MSKRKVIAGIVVSFLFLVFGTQNILGKTPVIAGSHTDNILTTTNNLSYQDFQNGGAKVLDDSCTLELISPVNDAIGVASNPVLQWNPVDGTDEYLLLVDTDSTLAGADTINTSATSFQLSQLYFATTYYWKVESFANNVQTNCSVVWHFKTGTTWNNVASFASGQIIWDLLQCGDYIFAGTWGGNVYRSDDSPNYEAWTKVDSGMHVAFVWSLACDDNQNIFAGTERGLYKSTNLGESWQLTSLVAGDSTVPPDVRAIEIDPYNTQLIVAATWGYGFFYSEDGGINWNEANDGLISLAGVAVTFSSDGYYTYFGTMDQGLYRIKTTDLGDAWSQLTGMPYRFDWTLLGTHNSMFDDIYAGTYGDGFYKSPDNGSTWVKRNNGLTENYVYALYEYEDGLYAGTWPGGVFKSSDRGETWEDLGLTGYTNLTGSSSDVSSILITSDHTGFAGTDDGKIYKTVSNSATTNVGENTNGKSNLPDDFSVQQNYPNPFNPSTIISFNLPRNGFVNISVYNSLGQKVAALLNRDLPAGFHQVEFNASNLASGIYFYQVRAGNSVKTMKMILMK